jgi:large subunit ribosomal protein L6
MSRIGKIPVAVPSGVNVDAKGRKVSVKGSKGTLSIDVPEGVAVAVENGQVVVTRDGDARQEKALHGLVRALVANMVHGVTAGFERKLEIVGVGYGAKVNGKKLDLTVGYSRPVSLNIPDGVNIALPDATHITVQGIDKQKVGQFAAEIRAVRKPEPYKGTGIKYEGEQVRRKAGKAFGAAGK